MKWYAMLGCRRKKYLNGRELASYHCLLQTSIWTMGCIVEHG